jgi:preprotein translocase subunit SecD
MTIHGQHGKRHLQFHTILVFTILAVIFTTALSGLSADQTGKHTFEVRLASHEKVEGWDMVPGPGPEKTTVWISPEVALTNGGVALAYPTRTRENKPCVGIIFTEEGSLKMARLTKSHVGEWLAVIFDGRVTWTPKISEGISERAIWYGNFTEEETESIAEWLSGEKIKFGSWKHKLTTGKIKFEFRLASNEKVEGWEIGLGPGPVWISPEVVLTNRDVARAYPEPDRTNQSKPGVGILLSEEGALKMARLAKSHIGSYLVVILDGKAFSVFPIVKEYTNGRALIPGNFTKEEAGSIAKGIMMK